MSELRGFDTWKETLPEDRYVRRFSARCYSCGATSVLEWLPNVNGYCCDACHRMRAEQDDIQRRLK